MVAFLPLWRLRAANDNPPPLAVRIGRWLMVVLVSGVVVVALAWSMV